MLLGLLAAVLFQEIPPDPHWTRVGPAVYAPVGVQASECFINLLPTIDFKGTSAEWHESVFKDVARDAGKNPERSKGPAGSFSHFSIVGEQDGIRRWYTFYTAVADGRAYLVVFLANTEALNKAHAAAAEALLSKTRVGPPPVAGGLRYLIPSGWVQRDAGGGTVQFIPPNLPAGADVSITIVPPQPSQVPPDSTLNQITFNMFMNKVEPAHQEGVIGSMGGFRVTIVRSKLHRIGLYAARWEGSVQTVFYTCNSDELYNTYGPAVERMIRTTEVPGFKKDPNAWHPKPLPPPDRDVKIVGAYFGAGLDVRNSVDPKAGGMASRNYREVLVLFENGVAARCDIVNSGLRDTTYLAEGFAILDVAGMQQSSDRRFGRWTEENGTITVQMSQGSPLKLARDGDNLKGQWSWTQLKPIDGLRPAGTFVRE
ncbi:MAG TPA: hypothetical protein VEN81_10510, partial [Planctomycetota bacterium]|nr:hypothetical protein [Planctomycetota bacterium]